MTVVTIENDLYGSVDAIAISIDSHEMIAEMPFTPPLSTRMTVSIGGIVWAHAKVVGHELLARDDRRLVRFRFYDGTDNVTAACSIH